MSGELEPREGWDPAPEVAGLRLVRDETIPVDEVCVLSDEDYLAHEREKRRPEMLDLFPQAPRLTEQERVIEEHVVRWKLEDPYCPAWVFARELSATLNDLSRRKGERRAG